MINSSINTLSSLTESINPAMNIKSKSNDKNVIESFGDVFSKALGQVNNLELKADTMVQTMITNPGKVNIHEVTALLSQAEMAVSMTKAVTDRVINAYRDITNLR
ncbi:MAG: flagellar hook-basal body complex protein FliE [Spirochaetota bacterium]|nr:flagellar hook-basal body complex protein FliE [Spirochaetota bacterium]